LTLLGDPSRRDLVGQSWFIFPISASVSDPRAILGTLSDGGTAVALQARHQLGGRVFLSWSLTRLDRRADNTPRDGPISDPVALARFDDNQSNVASGNYGYSLVNRLARTAGQVSVTVPAGSHVVKLGADYEANAIAYDGAMSFVQRIDGATYFWFHQILHTRARNSIASAYAQDSWEVSRRLLLALGVRWEGQFISGDTGIARWFAPEFAPRLGAVFQPGELGVQKLTASVGRFYEQVPMNGLVAWVGYYAGSTGFYPQNPLVDTAGGTVTAFSQAGEAPDRNLRGQYYDEVTAGYERLLGGTYRVGVRGTYRVLRWVAEEGARDIGSVFVMGNPGRGSLAYLPRARRDYTALEVTLERSGGPLTFLASYVLSRNWGNYTGLFATDMLVAGANGGPNFDYPDQLVNATGLLPNDRTHVLKLIASYRIPIGLTVGTSALLASGAPLSEYGTSLGGYPWWTFIHPRGTAGRTPTTWNVDLRFTYDVPLEGGARVRPRVLLDVFNVGNHHRPLTYDQRHYTTQDQTGVNPNYGTVTQYQAPMSARLGLVMAF
jgi:hypothetical protein